VSGILKAFGWLAIIAGFSLLFMGLIFLALRPGIMGLSQLVAAATMAVSCILSGALLAGAGSALEHLASLDRNMSLLVRRSAGGAGPVAYTPAAGGSANPGRPSSAAAALESAARRAGR
jgi:hypothetical protein